MNIIQGIGNLQSRTLREKLDFWNKLFPLRIPNLIVSVELKFRAMDLVPPDSELYVQVNHFVAMDFWALTDFILEDGPNEKEKKYIKEHK